MTDVVINIDNLHIVEPEGDGLTELEQAADREARHAAQEAIMNLEDELNMVKHESLMAIVSYVEYMKMKAREAYEEVRDIDDRANNDRAEAAMEAEEITYDLWKEADRISNVLENKLSQVYAEFYGKESM